LIFDKSFENKTVEATLKFIPAGLFADCIRNIDERPAIMSETDASASALQAGDFEAVLDQAPLSVVLASGVVVRVTIASATRKPSIFERGCPN
jgi:hypothetical protein